VLLDSISYIRASDPKLDYTGHWLMLVVVAVVVVVSVVGGDHHHQ
jgi:hypothetical protein